MQRITNLNKAFCFLPFSFELEWCKVREIVLEVQKTHTRNQKKMEKKFEFCDNLENYHVLVYVTCFIKNLKKNKTGWRDGIHWMQCTRFTNAKQLIKLSMMENGRILRVLYSCTVTRSEIRKCSSKAFWYFPFLIRIWTNHQDFNSVMQNKLHTNKNVFVCRTIFIVKSKIV